MGLSPSEYGDSQELECKPTVGEGHPPSALLGEVTLDRNFLTLFNVMLGSKLQSMEEEEDDDGSDNTLLMAGTGSVAVSIISLCAGKVGDVGSVGDNTMTSLSTTFLLALL